MWLRRCEIRGIRDVRSEITDVISVHTSFRRERERERISPLPPPSFPAYALPLFIHLSNIIIIIIADNVNQVFVLFSDVSIA